MSNIYHRTLFTEQDVIADAGAASWRGHGFRFPAGLEEIGRKATH
jgi:hypothetical protein